MLLRHDEEKLPKLFAHIRLRREQGLLIFISTNGENVEKYLKELDG